MQKYEAANRLSSNEFVRLIGVKKITFMEMVIKEIEDKRPSRRGKPFRLSAVVFLLAGAANATCSALELKECGKSSVLGNDEKPIDAPKEKPLPGNAMSLVFDSSPKPADKIDSPTDRYTLQKKIGEGAFGEVWKVTDSKGQAFALKRFKAQKNPFGVDEGILEAKIEFGLGQMLDHPHIVKTIDLFSDLRDPENPVPCLILELIDGCTLHQTSSKSLSLATCTASSIELVDALLYGLSRDLIYLDLQKHNIMISPTSGLMIIDIGGFFSFREVLLYFAARADYSWMESPANSPRWKKLDEFFKENAALAKELSGTVKKGGISSTTLPAAVVSYYLDKITNSCIEITAKSDLDREVKLELYACIKKLSWCYLEDRENGNPAPIEHYLEKLKHILSDQQASSAWIYPDASLDLAQARAPDCP